MVSGPNFARLLFNFLSSSTVRVSAALPKEPELESHWERISFICFICFFWSAFLMQQSPKIPQVNWLYFFFLAKIRIFYKSDGEDTDEKNSKKNQTAKLG